MQKWIYRHYKWNLYDIIWTCLHTETEEILVSYKPLYDSWIKEDFFVRPYNMFFENIEIDWKIILRFEYIWDKK
jgi:hypothetical protein